jgi:hypothetical protein
LIPPLTTLINYHNGLTNDPYSKGSDISPRDESIEARKVGVVGVQWYTSGGGGGGGGGGGKSEKKEVCGQPLQ